jgi:hypothetical protein
MDLDKPNIHPSVPSGQGKQPHGVKTNPPRIALADGAAGWRSITALYRA